MGDAGVDPGGVKVERRQHGLGQVLDLPFRQPIKAKGAHPLVRRKRRRSQDLGQPPGAEAAHGFHLPQTVLGMDEAEGEIGVAAGFGENMGNAGIVAVDLDRLLEDRDLNGAVGFGQRRPQPPKTGAADHQHHRPQP